MPIMRCKGSCFFVFLINSKRSSEREKILEGTENPFLNKKQNNKPIFLFKKQGNV